MIPYHTRAEYLVAAEQLLRRKQAILHQVRSGHSIGWKLADAEKLVLDALDTLWCAQEMVKRWLA